MEEAGDRTRARIAKREIPSTWHRPHDLEAAKVRCIRAMRLHGVLSEACRAGPIGRRVIYEVMKEDTKFRRAIYDARNDCLDELERSMLERGKYVKGDLAGIFVLKHSRQRFADKPTKIELTGKDGGPVLTQEVKQALTDRLAKLADALAGEAVEVVGRRKGPALVGDGDGASGVRRAEGSAGSAKPKRGVRVG